MLKTHKLLKLFVILFFSLTLAFPALGKTLKFTAIPDEDTTRLQKRFKKVANYLSDQLGVKVKYILKQIEMSMLANEFSAFRRLYIGRNTNSMDIFCHFGTE